MCVGVIRYWQGQFDEDFRYVPELKIKMVVLQNKMKENQDKALLEYIQADQMSVVNLHTHTYSTCTLYDHCICTLYFQ